MGRTLPSMTLQFMQEKEAYNRFRRALRRQDQHALDALFAQANQHIAAAAYAAHAMPMEVILLAMLIEHEKRLRLMENELQRLTLALSASIDYDLFERLKRVEEEEAAALLPDEAPPGEPEDDSSA